MGRSTAWQGLKVREQQVANTANICHDIVVRHVNNAIALSAQIGVPLGIPLNIVVRVAIDLDNEAFRRAEKVDNIITNHRLPPELIAAQLGA